RLLWRSNMRCRFYPVLRTNICAPQPLVPIAQVEPGARIRFGFRMSAVMSKRSELPAATGPGLLVDLNAKRSNDATPMLDFIGVEFGEFLAGHCPRLKAERLDTINKSRRLDNLAQLTIEPVQHRLWHTRRRVKTSPKRSEQFRMSHLCRCR